MIRSGSGTAAARGTRALVLLAAAALLVDGCAYVDMVRRHRRLREAFEQQPRLGLVQEFAPEECLEVVGGLLADPGRDEPLAIIALSHQYARNEVVGWRMVPGSVWYYSVLLPEGTYDLLVLADLNRDDVFGDDEVVGRLPPDASLVVARAASPDGVFAEGPTLRLDYGRPTTVDLPVELEVAVDDRVLPSLDDEFFDPGYGVMGLYDPAKFLEHTQGHLFGLEPFDADKTQVLFVHGASGTPRDWRYVVDGLDRTRFQPWFYYYPTGLPIERSGTVLARAIERLAASGEPPERVVVVAHSMGGLVARAALNRLTAAGRPNYLRGFITLSTPYGGHDAAEVAVARAPEVVPSWIDLAPESAFLRTVTAHPLPDDLPFYLLFGYGNPGRVHVGPASDGTITLRSELELRAQRQARRSYGFDVSHSGILEDAVVRQLLTELLEPAAPPPGVLEDPLGTMQRVFSAAD